ncbi:FliG C-terminal domain-containing protein [Paramagnetospirillum magneticum]|uniref:Flagellar motor component n=1 Tax=Paramagnetospirillum magneticum (strain ATCC 700264 / AMB-1) TaxID=342108 RepID=Q2W2F6_PARM1|nr:FliG C-terminal domain-containing protein [Paramagnetospirillum magneticum]BAE51969.1 Flagellar motor component [Paramagnetospirillum magneticum AMB-1]
MTIFSSAIQSVRALRREAPTREAALALLLCLYDLWVLAKVKGDLYLEAHAEMPLSSSLFFHHKPMRDLPWLLTPLVDFIRLMTLGSNNAKQARRLLQAYRETEKRALDHVLRQASLVWPMGFCLWIAGLAVLASLGGLGLTALAWWGVSLAAAGVMVGIWLVRLRTIADHRLGVLDAMTEGCLSYLNGYAQQICAENARFVLPPALKPSFFELADAFGEDSYFHRYGAYNGFTLSETGTQAEIDTKLAERLQAILDYDPDWLAKALPGLSRDITGELPADQVETVSAFSQLADLDEASLRIILQSCAHDLRAAALIGTSSAVLERFVANLSEADQKTLVTDIRAMGSIPAADIAIAQRSVLDLAKSLTDSGELAARTKEEGDLLTLWKRMSGEEGASGQPGRPEN